MTHKCVNNYHNNQWVGCAPKAYLGLLAPVTEFAFMLGLGK